VTIRLYLMRRANRTITGVAAFLLLAGALVSSGPRGFVLRFVFSVPIVAVVIAAFWSLFEVPCLNCRKHLGRVGFWVANGRMRGVSPQCPHCGISLDSEIPKMPTHIFPQSERNRPLRADETQVIGIWILQYGQPQGDVSCERIEWLVKHVLEKIADSPEGGGWETLYRDPVDGRFWERDYLHSEMHGGGPPRLRVLTVDAVKDKYVTP
jgi:Immunity protein 27